MNLPVDIHTLDTHLIEVFAGILAVSEDTLRVIRPRADAGADAMIETWDHVFVIALKTRGSAGPVSAAIRTLSNLHTPKNATRVVAVPYMNPSGRDVCEREGVSWFDFSGNARIIAPKMRILVEGRPNAYVTPGRPSSPFAPKSARISRWLLTHPDESFTQRDIAQNVAVSEGLVSRVVSRLEEDHYVARDQDGQVFVSQPDLLFDAWREDYRFDKHTLIKGHMAARSGDALARRVADTLADANVDHAATGLAAAWQIARFAGFRTTTFYTDREALRVLEDAGMRRVEKGANLWVVLPNDKGVFQGAAKRDGVRCVHPIQTLLDLDSQPERAAEAAKNLRAEHMEWGT